MEKRTILYVDDEESCLRVFELIFGDRFDVRTAPTPEDALALLEERAADIVISDQMMPGTDGKSFLREVTRRHPETYRVLLTGTSSVAAMLDEIGSGLIQTFLTKPWDEDSMQRELERAIASLDGRGRQRLETGRRVER